MQNLVFFQKDLDSFTYQLFVNCFTLTKLCLLYCCHYCCFRCDVCIFQHNFLYPAYSTSEESSTESNSEDCHYEPVVRKPRSVIKVGHIDSDEVEHVDGVENDDTVRSSCRLFEERDLDDIHVVLECKDLWMKFHELGTEMIITKAGRLDIFNSSPMALFVN